MSSVHPMPAYPTGFVVPLRTLVAALQEHTYKPGHQITLELDEAFDNRPRLVMSAHVTDTYHPDRTVRLRYVEPVPAFALEDRDMFLTHVRGFIRRFEEHESDEWWKHQGSPVRDPHQALPHPPRRLLGVDTHR